VLTGRPFGGSDSNEVSSNILSFFKDVCQQNLALFKQPGFKPQVSGQRESDASDATIPSPPKISRVEPAASASVEVVELSDVEEQAFSRADRGRGLTL
jgi:hypothetical protein